MKPTSKKRHTAPLSVLILLFLLPLAIAGQSPEILGGSARDVIENYWNMGVRGELLTRKGWEIASGSFESANPFPQDASIEVFSNYYGIDSAHITGTTATVEVGFTNVGRIDQQLRYTPPRKPPPGVLQTAFLFHLSVSPSYVFLYGSDGKTLVDKKPTGNSAWRIGDEPPVPWTTVNTAIRYVLEMRNKTTDPTIKKNADETVAKLLTLH